MEDTGHLTWQYQNLDETIKKEYQYTNQLVPSITQLPSKIINLLKNQDIEPNSNFFSDFFPEVSKRGNKSKQGETKKPDFPPLPPSNPNFEYRENRSENGFSLSLSEEGVKKGISQVIITVAYGTNQGNPFNNYQREDFDFSSEKDIQIKLKKGKQIQTDANKIVCKVKGEKFKITMNGFDPDRELKIDITEGT